MEFCKGLKKYAIAIVSLCLSSWGFADTTAQTEEPLTKNALLDTQLDYCFTPIDVTETEARYQGRKYRIGGVPINIGIGFIYASPSEGGKYLYQDDDFDNMGFRMKINPDGSYGYFDLFDTRKPWGTAHYPMNKFYEETEKQNWLKYNWMYVSVEVDKNIGNPSSRYIDFVSANSDRRRLLFDYVDFKKQTHRYDGEKYGLQYYQDIGIDKTFAEEFYIKANPDGCYLTVKTFINCDVDTHEPDRFPKCKQYFLIPKTRLVVELGYFKKFLPYWAYIQDTFTKHFEQEIIESTEGEK